MPTPPLTIKRLTKRVSASDTPGLNGLMGLAVGVVIVAALYVAREVLIPLTLAVLLSFMLGPVVAFLRRIHLPRALAVLVAVIAALSIVVLLGIAIGAQVAQLTNDIPRYAATVENKVSAVRDMAAKQLAAVTNGLGHISTAAPPPAANPGTPAAPGPLPVEVHQPAPGPLDLAKELLLPVVSPLATAAIVFVVAIFILMQREDLRDRLIRLFGSNDLHRTTSALDDAGYRLGRYYLSLLAVNTAFGVVIGAGLFFIGIPSPILWGIIAGLLRFVPYVGAFAGALFPITLAAAVDPGWTMMVETLGLFLVVEPILGQAIEPLIYGHSTGLSPVSVVISAIFWGWIWGGIGLLLSMPLTLCLVVLGKHIERLEFLDVLLGDQPALSPAEGLYQRMLVGDADEALEQAEAQLKEHPLAVYYDDVAIPGLQLAANDSLRGVLTDEQLHGIMESICGVIVDLGHEDEGDTNNADEVERLCASTTRIDGGWAEEGAILCVAGRGKLDEAVCAMLAQVLGQNGLPARIVPHEAVSRAQIGQLDLSGVRLICVSYLEGVNSLSPLRYLIRRLRQRSADLKIMVGLWDMDESLAQEERIHTAIGADLHVGSLQAAVKTCLELAEARPELAA